MLREKEGANGTIRDGPAPLAGYQLVGCWCATHSHWRSPRGSSEISLFFFQPDYCLVQSLSNLHLLRIEYFSKVKVGFRHKLLK